MGQDTKAGIAFNLLRRDILNGNHPSGKPLRVSNLSVRYGVGIAALRVALAQLTEMQLVVPTPPRGWQVASVSLAEFQDLLHARMTLEVALLEDAIDHGTKNWETNLLAAHFQLAQAVRPLGAADTLAYRQTWIALHDSFHAALLAGARSAWLKQNHLQLLDQMQRYHQAIMSLVSSNTDAMEPLLTDAFSIPRHGELVVAALDRDKPAAVTALKRHGDITFALSQRILGPDRAAD
ncbi:GntR family transcriptional regulator [Pseudorhodobacter ferrugineus]|uniref:GntR family transcriptional regulator n=1 Tax=Pseudorhodobacter ferrugineus TaxID=77008 RepID=UPI0003B42978|nr:FCD domain-containing protein [Pseudorhodobacter ferrugineus]